VRQRPMVDRLFIAGAVLALILTAVGADADPQAEPMLVSPVSPACISSPFGPRVLPNHPQAGTYHYGVDLPAPSGASIVATAPGKVIRIQKKGPGGLEILVQHDGFTAIYSHLGMAAPSFAQGKRTVAAGEKLGVVGRTGVTVGTHVYFEMLIAGKPVDPAPYLRVPTCGREVRPPSPASSPSSQ
jgi:murein DD-endopeptidase MepM/ murein hydrolase activator NlpD